MSDKVFYTLADAKVELARIECERMGHDYWLRLNGVGNPINLLCSRCERNWRIQAESQNEQATITDDSEN